MKKLLATLGALAALSLFGPTAAAAAPTAQTDIQNFEVDAGIQAAVSFVDNGPGGGLQVTGSGSGFQANGSYVSLIYDVGSVAENVTSAGFEPCVPTLAPGQPGFLNFSQMFVGAWLPMGSTKRTLNVTKTGTSFTPLGTFATMSIRRADAGFSLNECGAVTRTGSNRGTAEIAGFGVDSGIEAQVSFTDNGPTNGLAVTGSGEGFQPDGLYVSLIYDVGSVQSGVTAIGSGPCAPSRGPGQPGFLDFPQMVVGFWLTPDGHGTGTTMRTLKAVKTINGNITTVPPEFQIPPGPNPLLAPSYTPIGTFATMSVRRADAGFSLHACGQVEVEG